jgi:ABC-type polar amino acid transport system ATPase subunit
VADRPGIRPDIGPDIGPDDRIVVDHLSKSFGSIRAVRDASLRIKTGTVTIIIGPSGSGKSTVLRCMNHLEVPTSGAVYIDGVHLEAKDTDINTVRREIGMVFQQFNLFPHMSVLDNITLAQRMVRGRSKQEAVDVAMAQLERVGIPEQAHKRPGALSGGQQQRVAIARSLAMNPKAMLFDEPTSALDPEMIKEVLDVMLELAASGMTMVVVSHEMGFAREVGSHMVMMDFGEIVEEGRADEVFSNPCHPRTQEFFSKIL